MSNISDLNTSQDLALIICTRNRFQSMQDLLVNLDSQVVKPKWIIIVDSSDDNKLEMLLYTLPFVWSSQIIFIKSDPGLPYQRNLGIKRVFELDERKYIKMISFLDDDVRIEKNYFSNLRALTDLNKSFVAVTGVDVSQHDRKENLLRRIFLLGSNRKGLVLKSGITSPIGNLESITEVEWIPGCCMTIRRDILETTRFDPSLRMYGEDLKMSLELRKSGKLLCFPELKYRHLMSAIGRERLTDVVSYTNGIRWHLAKEFPLYMSKPLIMWSILGSLIFNSAVYVISRNRSKGEVAIGHLLFLGRMFLRKETVQRVSFKP